MSYDDGGYIPEFGTSRYWRLALWIFPVSLGLKLLAIWLRLDPIEKLLDAVTRDGDKITFPDQNHTVLYFLMVVAVGPLLEEICFRAWLVREPLFPLIGIGYITFCAAIVPVVELSNAVGVMLIGLIFLGVCSFIWRHSSYYWENSGPSALTWFAGGLSTIAFGLAHLSNYSSLPIPVHLMPLLVVPQLMGGVYLTYARIRLGLGTSVFMHASVNLGICLWGSISS